MTDETNSVLNCDVAIIVVAAGRGLRAGGAIPKQYRLVAGRHLLAMTIENLGAAAPGARIQPVIGAADADLFQALAEKLPPAIRTKMNPPVVGGATRQQSAKAGLDALSTSGKNIKIVLIHDAARPFVSNTLIQNAIEAAQQFGAAIPGCPVSDTMKQIDSLGAILATPPRHSLRAVQTPQAFRFELIQEAHRRAAAAGIVDLTDDAAVVEWTGRPVHVFAGDPANIKVTEPHDFARAEARILGDLQDIRTGQGFDVHAFGPGDHVWFGGVKIPHSMGLLGHSDADVLMHAITDAILGAICDGDIGSHFPPSDPQWKGAASDIFLRHAAGLVRARGGVIAHIDGTLICEAPKVGQHREAIRAALASILGVDIGRVAVKATTTEQLGFAGRREGIAAMATATVRLPMNRT